MSAFTRFTDSQDFVRFLMSSLNYNRELYDNNSDVLGDIEITKIDFLNGIIELSAGIDSYADAVSEEVQYELRDDQCYGYFNTGYFEVSQPVDASFCQPED